LDGADGADRTALVRSRFEVGAGTREQPTNLTLSIDDAMLDIERAITLRIVGATHRERDAVDVFWMNVRQDFRERHRLVSVPAVHLPQLQRPEDDSRSVVVLEDSDVSNSDCLQQALVVFRHHARLRSYRTL
jgi:hypothetical protein